MQLYYIQYPPMYPNYDLPQRPVVSSNDLVKKDIDCSKARFKVFTAEVVSLRFVWYSKAKAATYAQEGGNGTTSGNRAKDVNDNEEGVAAQTSCFNIDLSKTCPM